MAEGTYKPDPTGLSDPRLATFQLKSGVNIKGCYAGYGETDPDARDTAKNETFLSGDLSGNDASVTDPADLLDETTRAENCYHVVTGNGTSDTTILDGFTIIAGNANGAVEALQYGGGLNIEPDGSPTLVNCIFSENSALKFGGGMASDIETAPMVLNCTFTRNAAGIEGGGIINNSRKLVMAGCSFNDNAAMYGGGISTGTERYDVGPLIIDCTFTGNRSSEYGGAVFNWKCIASIVNCTFKNNLAAKYGGGMVNMLSDLTMVNCVFNGNAAGYDGGGYMDWDDGDSTLTNCLFSGNAVKDDYGGGIFYWDNSGSLKLTNCTFNGNSAYDGNALGCNSYQQLKPGNITLVNCILWDEDNEIWNYDNSTITVTYSDVYGGLTGQGNINAVPSFANPGHWDDNGTQNDPTDDFWVDGDYNLLSSSPCIDAGNNTAVPPDADDIDDDGNTSEQIPLDLYGRERFIDDPATTDTGSGTPPIVDMGAYEFPGGIAEYHPADTDNNCVISMLEILGYIDKWAVGDVGMLEVLEGIDLWAAGHYYWDPSDGKFKPGDEP